MTIAEFEFIRPFFECCGITHYWFPPLDALPLSLSGPCHRLFALYC